MHENARTFERKTQRKISLNYTLLMLYWEFLNRTPSQVEDQQQQQKLRNKKKERRKNIEKTEKLKPYVTFTWICAHTRAKML